MRSSLKLAAVLALGILAMSSASILIRFALAEGAPPLVIAAYRLATAVLILSGLGLRQRIWQEYATLGFHEWSVLIVGGILLALHFAAWITSLAHTSVLSSVVLVTTTPLWLGLASPLLLGEPTPRRTWFGIAAAMVGGMLIGLGNLGETGGTSQWGDLLALLGAWFMAGYLLVGRSARTKIAFTPYLWLVYAVAAVTLSAWAAWSGLLLRHYSPQAMFYMIALGIVPQLIGHSAANYAIRHLPVSVVGVTTLGEPIGATILAYIVLNEHLKPLQLVGGALILGGIAASSVNVSPTKPAEPSRGAGEQAGSVE